VRYAKDGPLGGGAFGRVYRGSCRGQLCAIKTPIAEVDPQDWAFLDELDALARLDHDNVIGFKGEDP